MFQRPPPTATSSREEYSIPAEQTDRSYKDNSKTQHSGAEDFRYLPQPFRSPTPYVSPYPPLPERQSQLPLTPILRSRHSSPSGPSVSASSGATLSAPTSAYSSSSQDQTIYSNLGSRQYKFDFPGTMGRPLSQVSSPLDWSIDLSRYPYTPIFPIRKLLTRICLHYFFVIGVFVEHMIFNLLCPLILDHPIVRERNPRPILTHAPRKHFDRTPPH